MNHMPVFYIGAGRSTKYTICKAPPGTGLIFYKYGHSFTAGMLSFSQIRRQQNTLSEKALQPNACIFHLRQINDTHAAKRMI